MKKILGVSFAAMLAVSPMLANAAVTKTSAPIAAANTDVTANTNVATTSYVKGAYKAMATEVNRVQADVANVITDINVTTEVEGGVVKSTNSVASNLTALDTKVKEVASSNATTAGAGLSKSEQGQFSVKVDNTTVGINASNELEVKSSGIGTTQLADSAVSTAKIDAGAVTTAKIADGNVTLQKIDSAAMQNATDQTQAAKTKLTTQGYVDEAIAGVTNAAANFATKDLDNLTTTGKANISAQGTYDAATPYTAGTVGAAIKANADAISAEASRATGVESGLNTRLTAAETAITTINNSVLPVYGTWDSDAATNTVTIGSLASAQQGSGNSGNNG